MTPQSPTPGQALTVASVKLLRKGDLLWSKVHEQSVSVIKAVEAAVSYRHPDFAPDGCVVLRTGLKWLTFIGRPDADGWMPWSGGENPVPGQKVVLRLQSGIQSGVFASEELDWSCACRFRLPTAPASDVAGGVERENLAGKLRAIRDKFLIPTPDKDFTDYAVMTRCVEALIRPAAPDAPGGGWRPIETAPKDGTVIHVWADGFEWPEAVRWEMYEAGDAEEAGEPGYWTYAEPLLADVTDEDWTHWMPLPAPPAIPAQPSEGGEG